MIIRLFVFAPGRLEWGREWVKTDTKMRGERDEIRSNVGWVSEEVESVVMG